MPAAIQGVRLPETAPAGGSLLHAGARHRNRWMGSDNVAVSGGGAIEAHFIRPIITNCLRRGRPERAYADFIFLDAHFRVHYRERRPGSQRLRRRVCLDSVQRCFRQFGELGRLHCRPGDVNEQSADPLSVIGVQTILDAASHA
jgi:hypothetical protein